MSNIEATDDFAPDIEADRTIEDTCEAEITPVFRRPRPPVGKQLRLIGAATGNTPAGPKAR